MNNENYGCKIKRIRKKNKLTQVEFAKKIGITQSHLSKVERGDENSSLPVRKLICILFNVPNKHLGAD